MRKRIYVAGLYSADNVMDIFNNMKIGMRWATRLFLLGFAPFCPWHDYHHSLMLRGDEKLTIDDYYEYSLSWLDASDAVFLLTHEDSTGKTFNESVGVTMELDHANDVGIPIYCDYNLDKMIRDLIIKDLS